MDGKAVSRIQPNSIAAGAIYSASQELDLDVTQREIEAVAQCNVSTIGKMRNLVKESIEP